MTDPHADPCTLVAGHEAVLTAFGHWPGFDEAEVLQLVLDSTRLDADGRRCASIDLDLKAWHLIDDGTGALVFDGQRSSVIRFLFEHVYDVELDGLNHQNVLSGLHLTVVAHRARGGSNDLAIELEHCYGLSGSFKAASARVVSVRPCGVPGAT